ncbi:hypothetical protein PCA31118_02424 [Pandoraea captiosa]|uniref:Uncharacterized protein n=1 Tax=Pandoraea captiosa TaxID=2508302 RepID=A0A5E5A4A5_9BURK|nr:hypothetical protein [Pandoraea captiosa]VVE66970.1 hypothetical protein PCA31118_02424 [Pandoraea captiosa]
MDFLSTYGKEILALVAPLGTWLVKYRARAKVIWASPHSFTFLIQEPQIGPEGEILNSTQTATTASIRVMNLGHDPATKVELVFNWKPQYLNIWPVRHYEEKIDQDRRHIMIFNTLSAKEDVNIEIMSINTPLPELIHVRTAECVGRRTNMMWTPFVPKWQINLAVIFMALGASVVVYGALSLLQLVILKTPSL